jgi:hypothetical protein
VSILFQRIQQKKSVMDGIISKKFPEFFLYSRDCYQVSAICDMQGGRDTGGGIKGGGVFLFTSFK